MFLTMVCYNKHNYYFRHYHLRVSTCTMFRKPVSIIRCKQGRAPTEGMRLFMMDPNPSSLTSDNRKRSSLQNVTSEKPQNNEQSLKLYCKVIQMAHH